VNLARNLGTDRPFFGFEAPGLLDGGRPFDSVEALAEHYAAAMRAVQPDGPYHVGGWSSGGPVAFEIARVLEAQGARVAVLAMLDCGLMHSDVPAGAGFSLKASLDGLRLLGTFALQMGLPRSYAQLRAIAQMGGISLPHTLREALRPRFLRRLLANVRHSADVFRTNTLAGIRYEPKPYAGRVALFRATGSQAHDPDPVLEYLERFALGGVDRYVVPGNHMSIILEETGSKTLAELLRSRLNET
jgi:thioesterase domain-containing protein